MKSGVMMPEGALLDTSFFLRFLNENDPLFHNADRYFRYFLEKDFRLYISTISIAEYCVGGSIDQLPLRNLMVLPFNVNHAQRAGEFAKIIYEARRVGQINISERPIIINDAKLFAQADSESNISFFVTSDARSINIIQQLKRILNPNFEMVDIHKTYAEEFGLLDLE